MADRVPASITIGGTVPATILADLIQIIKDEGLSTDPDDQEFQPSALTHGEPVTLYANEVPWGSFDLLEPFCHQHGLAYSRWSAGFAGVWGSLRSIYKGQAANGEGNDTEEYDTSDDDQIFLGETRARQLGSYAAIMAYFEQANFTVPPLTIRATSEALQREATDAQA
jgi:hypothetical protein